MSEVKVSIYCAVYNHALYLRQCLNGFVMQKTNFKYEAIIHDDASTDDSVAIIKEYALKYPDIIKPIFQTENQYSKGILIVNEYILPKCSGDIIAICEGDDFWTDENKLQKQYDFMCDNPNCSIVTHAVTKVNKRNNKKSYCGPAMQSRYFTADEIIIGGGVFVPTCSIMMKKEVRQSLPDCFKCKGIADYQIQIYAAIVGDFYYMSDCMGVYNAYSSQDAWSTKNSTTQRSLEYKRNIIDMLGRVNQFYNYKYNDAIKKAINIFRFDIELLLGNYSLLKKEFKEIYKAQSIKRKVGINIGLLSPNLIKMIIKVYYKLVLKIKN